MKKKLLLFGILLFIIILLYIGSSFYFTGGNTPLKTSFGRNNINNSLIPASIGHKWDILTNPANMLIHLMTPLISRKVLLRYLYCQVFCVNSL